jgi:hypothetical protein
MKPIFKALGILFSLLLWLGLIALVMSSCSRYGCPADGHCKYINKTFNK